MEWNKSTFILEIKVIYSIIVNDLKKYSRTFKSDPELLPDIEDYITDIIKDLNIPDTLKSNIEIVIAEAAANSIIHGNKGDVSKNIHIRLKLNTKELCISFTDEGSGFNPDKIPDPTIPENILKGSGRGIHIMKSLVDKIEYKFSGKGTELILTFKI